MSNANCWKQQKSTDAPWEKHEATVSKETWERNSRQQIGLGSTGQVCQPENETQAVWLALFSVTALEGNTYYLGHCDQQSYGIVILSVGTYRKDAGETHCLESSWGHSHLWESLLPLLSITPCQNPPQESTKEETWFLHAYFALFRAGTNPNCWRCGLTIIFLMTQEFRTPNLPGSTPLWLWWTLEHFFSLLSWVCSCWYNDTSANKGIMKLCAWDTHKETPIKHFL